ncbi:MAG TPA: sulfatase-like hydrolase/transferase, partial [Solirubrobacterales bacterium]|nr:sulfatase-like hydrolase/transferase [Solirubrobacterales bacterium]
MSERDTEAGRQGLTRKELIGSGAGAAAAALLAGSGVDRAVAAAKGGGKSVAGMNMILILTDQERAIQHFPKNWLRKNLPGMRRLRQHGLSFERAFTNACMCSPARSTLMTGFFPAQHGVKYTLEEDMPYPEYPLQAEMPRPPELTNPATVMRAAGYTPVYKGKWHCSKPATKEDAKPSDLARYGWDRWNPPDAGANQTVPEAGGGYIDNDGRFIESVGSTEEGKEGVMQYLSSVAAKQQPFFLVISLVNPHDVLFFPSKTFEEAGYDKSWIRGELEPPATAEESLRTKPTVQEEFRNIFNLTGKPKGPIQQAQYLNFYGNLMRSSDNYIVDVLNKLEETGLYDDTLIVRTADHGE